MKRFCLLIMAMASIVMLRAQWVDDPVNNTFIANCDDDAGEIYLATDEVSGNTYVQWAEMRSNGWVPILQCLDFEGYPQWGSEGIPMTNPDLATWSPGYAMAATNDGGVVSVFRTASAHHYAVRINADGTFPWGEDGIMLFNGNGGDRSEVMAGNDGGVWALGTDYDYTYLQYVNADGTLGPVATLGDGERNYMFGLMVPAADDGIFLVFEKEVWAYSYYYEKEIWVVGYNRDGEQTISEVQLMNPYTIGGSYAHYVVPDGLGGGYAYIWHPALGDSFNTYVFHFDANGNSTISDLNGVAVHTADPSNFYLDAYGTVDPISHDLIIGYQQTDAMTQSQNRIYMNRITTTGEKVWGEGILVADNTGANYAEVKVDAFEDGSGFSVIYMEDDYVQAKGFDMDGNLQWTKQMCSNRNNKSFCDNSAGFHLGQNIVAWVDSDNSRVYGQNIGLDGTMGPVVIPEPCLAPEDFEGEYIYDMENQAFGVKLTWVAPENQPLHYNLYRYDLSNVKENIIIEVEGTATSYYDESGMGQYKYQLTAVYENCESDFALTPEGENYLNIDVTGLSENSTEEMVTVLKVYTMNGQHIDILDTNELPAGIYILRGLTQDGCLVSRKVIVK